jgi:hypothetical protein
MLYLSLSYYLLPSIAITLKVRKRKLFLQSAASSHTTELSANSYLHILGTNLEKISQLPIVQSSKEMSASTTPSANISAYVLENEVVKKFSADFFQKVSNTTLLHK